MAKSKKGVEAHYRFGGHQSFAMRIAWLPKVAAAIGEGSDPLTDPLKGVIDLGLGKNMVEALRCWVEAYGVARRVGAEWQLTPEGAAVFGMTGYDRFLEDEQTLWLLHWNISTLRESPFFAWELLINRWNEQRFTASDVVSSFKREAERTGRPLSDVSARQHFDVWLHTYLPTRAAAKLSEECLDSPLAALRIVRTAGDRDGPQGRRETIYAFDLNPKRGISQALFAHCLHDWWDNEYGNEKTIPFSAIAFSRKSPGRVFRMPDAEVRDRLAKLATAPQPSIELIESLNQYALRRRHRPRPERLMAEIYSSSVGPTQGLEAAYA